MLLGINEALAVRGLRLGHRVGEHMGVLSSKNEHCSVLEVKI
jgi:hypothetical protein